MTEMRATRGTILGAVTVSLALITAPAHAALITFTGTDAGAGSLATAPNSVAAAGSFAAAVAALGTENTLTFEVRLQHDSGRFEFSATIRWNCYIFL